MNALTPYARPGVPVSTDETRLSFERVCASLAWYHMSLGNEGKARELVADVAEHLPAALAECQARLVPVDASDVGGRLGKILTLCAGAGLDGDDRAEWLAAAGEALKGIPADLLDVAIRHARPRADHPSKIIPLMMAAVMPAWDARRKARARAARLVEMTQAAPPPSASAADAIDPSEVDEANALMRKFKLATRYRADGSPYQLAAGAPDPAVKEEDHGAR